MGLYLWVRCWLPAIYLSWYLILLLSILHRKAAIYSGFFLFLMALFFPGLLFAGQSHFPFDLQRLLLLVFVPAAVCFFAGLRWAGLYIIATLCAVGVVFYNPYFKQLSYGVILFVGAYFFYRSQLSIQWLGLCFGLIITLSAILFSICYVSFLNVGIDFYWLECFSFVSHPRFFNHFQVASMPVLLFFLAGTTQNRNVPHFAFLLILLSLLLANVSAGRGVWLSMLASVCCFAALLGKEALPYILKIAVACLLSWLIVVLVGHGLENAGRGFGLLSSRELLSGSRGELWHFAWQGIVEKPWWGWGAYSFGMNNELPFHLPAHPHQIVLQLAYEYGLIISALVSVMVFIITLRLAYLIRQSQDKIALAYFSGLIGLLVNAQYSGVFTMPIGQFMLLLLSGLLLSRVHHVGQSLLPGFYPASKTAILQRYLWLPAILILAVCTAVWINVVVDYFGKKTHHHWNIEHQRQGAKPRTWQDAS